VKNHKERVEQMNAMVALLASYVRCGKRWDDACETAYARVRELIAAAPEPEPVKPEPVKRFHAVDPSQPCTWPTGSCRFAKS